MKIEKTRHRLDGEKRALLPSKQEAKSIALQCLVFLAEDEERAGRFLALTGADPSDLRSLSETSAFQLAVLEYFCSDEPLLLAFASAQALAPERIAAARFALGGAPE
jgi:hypothetical protein